MGENHLQDLKSSPLNLPIRVALFHAKALGCGGNPFPVLKSPLNFTS